MVMGELPERAEVLVIGGGPGGYAAAFRAADLGLDVTLVSDEERLGGVCLLRGCIPSKALLDVAGLLVRSQEASRRGVYFSDPRVDIDELRGWCDGVIGQLTDGLAAIARRRGVHLVQGRATFESQAEVHISGSDSAGTIEFGHAIIATGSAPIALPGTEFGGRIMDSAAALALPGIPKRLLVVGGGYVGLELATVYAALGSAVTVAEMTDRLLPMADPDLARPVHQHLARRLEAIRTRTAITELAETGDGVRAVLESNGKSGEEYFDKALVAVGRRPRTSALGLEHTLAELDEQGLVIVDEQRRSTDHGIWAIGDITGGQRLAHEAMAEGKVAAEVIARQPAAFDPRAVPAVVYTDPEVAWCGLTEQDAARQGREVEISRYPWRASGRALTMGSADGVTKLVTEPGPGRVLGAGITGRGAESLIAEAVLAIEMGAVAEDLALSIAPHPTVSETIHEAAELRLGHPTHLPPARER